MNFLLEIFSNVGTPCLSGSLTFLNNSTAETLGSLPASINLLTGCILEPIIATSPACTIKSLPPINLSEFFTASPKPFGSF